MKRIHYLLILLAVVGVAFVFKPYVKLAISPLTNKITGRKTVANRLAQFGEMARGRLQPDFERARVAYPPAMVKLVAVKADRMMIVYAAGKDGIYHWIHNYPILAASGYLGPKLREGDDQVPEGIYPVESLNPNSLFHVALRVGYPSEFDRSMAVKAGRKNLGGDIMIHGDSISIGCLAMGDEAAEDLFVLAADVGLPNISVVITPVDFRKGATIPKQAKLPEWSDVLYSQIKAQLAALPSEESK